MYIRVENAGLGVEQPALVAWGLSTCFAARAPSGGEVGEPATALLPPARADARGTGPYLRKEDWS